MAGIMLAFERAHTMAKIVSAHHQESEQGKAREYVKSFILFPSTVLSLVFMVAAAAAMLYQFFSGGYSWATFFETGALLLAGGALGWCQTRYHRYLLTEHPNHFAARMRTVSRVGPRRPRKETPAPVLRHRGRALVPWVYVVGGAALIAVGLTASLTGHTYILAGLFLPWAGFFWAKMFFWRGSLDLKKA